MCPHAVLLGPATQPRTKTYDYGWDYGWGYGILPVGVTGFYHARKHTITAGITAGVTGFYPLGLRLGWGSGLQTHPIPSLNVLTYTIHE